MRKPFYAYIYSLKLSFAIIYMYTFVHLVQTELCNIHNAQSRQKCIVLYTHIHVRLFTKYAAVRRPLHQTYKNDSITKFHPCIAMLCRRPACPPCQYTTSPGHCPEVTIYCHVFSVELILTPLAMCRRQNCPSRPVSDAPGVKSSVRTRRAHIALLRSEIACL